MDVTQERGCLSRRKGLISVRWLLEFCFLFAFSDMVMVNMWAKTYVDDISAVTSPGIAFSDHCALTHEHNLATSLIEDIAKSS
jgi:hypothetical protein